MKAKAKLIKKNDIAQAPRLEPAPTPAAKKDARPGGPAVDPRAAFEALFAKK
jgi:hypothetical protein